MTEHTDTIRTLNYPTCSLCGCELQTLNGPGTHLLCRAAERATVERIAAWLETGCHAGIENVGGHRMPRKCDVAAAIRRGDWKDTDD